MIPTVQPPIYLRFEQNLQVSKPIMFIVLSTLKAKGTISLEEIYCPKEVDAKCMVSSSRAGGRWEIDSRGKVESRGEGDSRAYREPGLASDTRTQPL